jgi:GntR family transcriptional regulator / MocR family aminotransferase
VRVDEDGVVVDDLGDCRAVVVTAAHQFPLGVALHPARRHALLAWAREHDGVVIEDDYDAEHRYDRPALRAMQAMDPNRVAYVGSVSKTLAPALRLGWLVLPAALRTAAVRHKRLTDLGCSPLPQAAFARLLTSGGYDRHLRRTRTLYRARRDALLTALAEHLPAWRPVGVAAGLHVVLRLPDGTDDALLTARLANRGIHAMALSTYADEPPYPGLVLGYAATSPDRLRAAVAEIAATPLA